jgi:hypothetical protein
MATAKDFYGFAYDDTHPSFIILPPPPHPMTETGGVKFVYHRMTGHVLELNALIARMTAAEYEPGPNEIGDDDDWLRANTDYLGVDDSAPKEFVLTVNEDTTRAYKLSFTLSGGPATARQLVRMDASVGGQKMTMPAYNPSVDSFWIEVGDTVTEVLAKLDVLDMKAGASANPDFDEYMDIEYGLDTTAKDAAAVTFTGRMNFGPAKPVDANKYIGDGFEIIGMDMVWDGVPDIPAGAVTSVLAADGMSATVTISGGPLPEVPYAPYEFNMRAMSANGGEAAALSTNGQKVQVDIAAGLSNEDMAAALATGLDGVVMPIQNSPGPFTMHAVQNAAPDADSITITLTETDSGDPARMDYPPYFRIY